MNTKMILAAALAVVTLPMAAPEAMAEPAKVATVRSGYVEPLSSENSFLVLVDLQDMFGLTIGSIDQTALVNNALGVAKAAKVFNVPTVLATANARTFAGPFFAQVTEARKELPVYDRTAINLWDDTRVVDEIRRSGRKKIVIGGLWTANCVMLPALSALAEGYEVYILTDVSGDISRETHDRAVQRLIQAGATPINWIALMLEWQRDWARKETAGKVGEIAKAHGGAWGLGASYVGAMRGGSASQ
jgi:nicotinamidase-related amidase